MTKNDQWDTLANEIVFNDDNFREALELADDEAIAVALAEALRIAARDGAFE